MNFQLKFFTSTVLIESGHSLWKNGQGGNNVKDWVQTLINDEAYIIAKARRNFGIKHWFIIEPTERETDFVDEAMTYIFSVGTDHLIDTIEEMNKFCRYCIQLSNYSLDKKEEHYFCFSISLIKQHLFSKI